ncbi:hypothetical protein LV89_03452 [Arcicella aurantiaca]|uniref:Hemolytic protein HlpA-like protein n=1 Tax=Arcicella aurantiaca TaxID=591202 RepID=A0A316DVM3_9BACT|nr:nucleotide-diphospho-sugar transferase [Arcicella aurantiaca]PWK22387.1 hypothetical protein LV89_03452 [Arcicella aurantiaca]
MSYNIPILFVVFKRPDTTLRVFEAIREMKPSKLYIAADGHRETVLGEKELCEEVKGIITNIDWVCDVQYLFQSENLGSALNVTRAISWVFAKEERCIILEDDTLPNKSFWHFMEEMLERYKDEKTIMQVNALCPYKNIAQPDFSYTFSRCLYHCWGWATWKRAWLNFDFDMQKYEEYKSNKSIESIIRQPILRYLYQRNFQKHKFFLPKSWDGRWVSSCLVEFGLSIVPHKNMIINLGLNHKYASHTTDGVHPFSTLKLEKMEFPLKHPTQIVVSEELEENGLKSFFDISIGKIFHVLLKKPLKEFTIFISYVKENHLVFLK